MASSFRRFTVSIPQEMEPDLDRAKREVYYKTSQNAMIRDLIARGLVELNKDLAAEEHIGLSQGKLSK